MGFPIATVSRCTSLSNALSNACKDMVLIMGNNDICEHGVYRTLCSSCGEMTDKQRRATDLIGRGTPRVQTFILRLMATESDADRPEDNDLEAKDVISNQLDAAIQSVSDNLPDGYYLKLDEY